MDCLDSRDFQRFLPSGGGEENEKALNSGRMVAVLSVGQFGDRDEASAARHGGAWGAVS